MPPRKGTNSPAGQAAVAVDHDPDHDSDTTPEDKVPPRSSRRQQKGAKSDVKSVSKPVVPRGDPVSPKPSRPRRAASASASAFTSPKKTGKNKSPTSAHCETPPTTLDVMPQWLQKHLQQFTEDLLKRIPQAAPADPKTNRARKRKALEQLNVPTRPPTESDHDTVSDSDEPKVKGTPNRRQVRKKYHEERDRRQHLEEENQMLRELYQERQFRACEQAVTRARYTR